MQNTSGGKPIRIVITGPESVGKTTISRQLATHFQVNYVPEYAREYVENLGRECNFLDVIEIAKTQIAKEKEMSSATNGLMFLDTDLIVTKVWFEIVYDKVPDFVLQNLLHTQNRYHLLLDTSVEWKADSIRENGGKKREWIFELYQKELENYNLPFTIIRSTGQERLEEAINTVKRIIV